MAMDTTLTGTPERAPSMTMSHTSCTIFRGLIGQVMYERIGRSRSFSAPPAMAAAISRMRLAR